MVHSILIRPYITNTLTIVLLQFLVSIIFTISWYLPNVWLHSVVLHVLFILWDQLYFILFNDLVHVNFRFDVFFWLLYMKWGQTYNTCVKLIRETFIIRKHNIFNKMGWWLMFIIFTWDILKGYFLVIFSIHTILFLLNPTIYLPIVWTNIDSR